MKHGLLHGIFPRSDPLQRHSLRHGRHSHLLDRIGRAQLDQVGRNARRGPRLRLPYRAWLPRHRDGGQACAPTSTARRNSRSSKTSKSPTARAHRAARRAGTAGGAAADRWTVVTSATERLARARLAAGGIPVPERIVTAEHVLSGKPHPEPFLAGAALLGFAPEECVVFEDSASGAEAGRAAGCTVVATTFSHRRSNRWTPRTTWCDLTGVTRRSSRRSAKASPCSFILARPTLASYSFASMRRPCGSCRGRD